MQTRPLAALLCSILCVLPSSAARVRSPRRHKTGKVLTLGDSYASGAGIHIDSSRYTGGGCLRELEGVPGAKYAAKHGMEFHNEACAGWQTSHLIRDMGLLETKYAADFSEKWDGSVITLTIGGNDIRTLGGERWEFLLIRCVLPTGCSIDHADNQPGNLDVVESSVRQVYEWLATGASKARIRIGGYPRLMQYDKSEWTCWAVPGIHVAEAHWIDGMVDDLNAALRRAVAATKSAHPDVDIEFVDVTDDITRGACWWKGRQIHNVVFENGVIPSPATIHPTQAGQDGYLAAYERSLE